MAKVTNWKVYDLCESILSSGYPMLAEMPVQNELNSILGEIEADVDFGNYENRHIKRAISLANTTGRGHDNFLKGILVAFDLTFSNKAWVEMERYQFCQIVSSQSTMHRILSMDLIKCCHGKVDNQTIENLEVLKSLYEIEKNAEIKEQLYLKLLYNLPSGFELTARMTTNYLCLKNIYRQRRPHRLPDWHVFCDWIEGLPLAKEFICVGVE